ncbi:MAG: hypothetical protein M1575_01370 [Patescibacteria group bacterium]|nr:hypothetical protein [Patescibacteria group bacterium]MCL5095366.1 hypothetical protein [Patescibacteria group bacterium]
MSDKKIGKITHFYDKIGVAVVSLFGGLKVGDQIKISGHDQEFSQTVSSIQIEHEKINEAKKGQIVGLKVEKPVKESDEIFKVE